jgi:hypothetical protein
MNNEFKRMQKLAGLITENQINEEYTFNDNDKAYGVLFVDNDDKEEIGNVDYMWDYDAYYALVKSMGYKDFEEIAEEMTEFFPAGEDEMNIFRRQNSNPNLQPTDLTIGMYKKDIEKEFPKNEPKQGIGLDNLKRAGGNYLSPHIGY